MYKLCKSEQSALRQRQIEDALLAELGVRRYEEITVSALCQRLGMPRKTFYRYFAGKDGALFALIDHRLLEYGHLAPELRKKGFTLDLDWFFRFWLMQKSLLDALERSGISGILVERAIRNSQEALIFRMEGVSREYMAASTAFTVCGLMSMVLSWHHEGYRQTPEEMARLARMMLSQPLIPGINE